MPTLELSPTDLVHLLRDLHAKLRRALADLDQESLNWTPGPDTSSIAGLVTHLLSSERRNLLRVTGEDAPRNPGDIAARARDGQELLRAVDAADALLAEVPERFATRLVDVVQHPVRGPQATSLLLLDTYGHLREHLAQLELTRQLALLQRPPRHG
jgi:DinB superfamily